MTYQILDVANPIRRSTNAIDLLLKLTTPGGEVEVPFTATPNDPESHGRELYQNAINGLYGPIEGEEQ